MENVDIEKYIVKNGEEAEPIIVLTGTVAEFEDFCRLTNRNTKNAFAVRQGYQIPLYPELPIALWGNFWLNSAYDTLEYKDRLHKSRMQEMRDK